MISKQLMAFCAGITMVVACAGAFVLYDQKNGPEIQSDADTTGDGKVSNDPTSGFLSYDGHKYNLHYGSASISSSKQTFTTTYTIQFDESRHGLLTGYVNNIKVNLYGSKDTVLYHPGSNLISCTTSGTDLDNSGLALLKQMRYVFVPLEEKKDSSVTITKEVVTYPLNDTVNTGSGTSQSGQTYTQTYYYLNYPVNLETGKTADLYIDNGFRLSVTLDNTGKTRLLESLTYSLWDINWLVVGNSIYPVSYISS